MVFQEKEQFFFDADLLIFMKAKLQERLKRL